MRGLNLTAQTDVSSAMTKIAGYKALSSANAYPSIQIGDGTNNQSKGINKSIKDSQNYVKNTLNPDFYRFYELDACVPEDWNFKLIIQDHQTFWANSVIGSSVVDIEDRMYADHKKLQSIVLKE